MSFLLKVSLGELCVTAVRDSRTPHSGAGLTRTAKCLDSAITTNTAFYLHPS